MEIEYHDSVPGPHIAELREVSSAPWSSAVVLHSHNAHGTARAGYMVGQPTGCAIAGKALLRGPPPEAGECHQ